MGIGALFHHRDLKITTEDTLSGETAIHTIVTGSGAYPDWHTRGPYRGAMGVPAADRCASLLADMLAVLPWHEYAELGDGRAEQVATPLILTEPFPGEDAVSTWSSMALDLIWHGNAIAVHGSYSPLGLPTSLIPVPAEYVHVKRVTPGDGIALPIGSVAYWVAPAGVTDGADPGAGRWYSAREVMHIKGRARPGALVGFGVLESHLSTLDLAHEHRKQAAAASGAGIPTGVLKSENPDLTPDEAAVLKSGWMAAQSSRTIAVLNQTTSFEALAWNPTEAQLLDARKFGLHEIALIFGLDPSWVGAAQASRTYSNIEQDGINLWRYASLAGHLARFEAALSGLVEPGHHVRANVDSRLRPDTKTRYEAHQLGIAAGWLLPSEVRSLEDLPPVAGIDDPPEPPAPAGPPAGPEQARSEADLWIYWTTGRGKAKWATQPKPLLALYRQLLKHFTPERARFTALSWFVDGMGRAIKGTDGVLPDDPDPDPVRRAWNEGDHPRAPDGKFGHRLTEKALEDDYRARVTLTPAEGYALGHYTTGRYIDINNHLRDTGPADADAVADAAALEALTKRYTTPAPMTAWRGVKITEDYQPSPNMVGKVITDHGFVSTGAEKPAAGFDTHDILIQIDVPAGTHGIAVNGTKEDGFRSEREFILAPGARMVVESQETVTEPGRDPQLRLKATLLPPVQDMPSYDDERDNR